MVKKNLKRNRSGSGSGLGLFFTALLLGAVAQALVMQEVPTWGHQLPGWALFVTGGVLLFMAWRQAKVQPLPEALPRAWEAGALLVIVLFAAWMRLDGLQSYPNGGFRDEGENGNVAIQIMKGEPVEGTGQLYPAYIEQNTQNAAGYFYPVAASFKLFGVSITSVRYVSVFFGVLGVLAFYVLARYCFGAGLGLMLAACLAAMRWHLNFSRIGFLGIMTVFLSLPMLVLLLKGLREPADPATRKFKAPLFGLAVALAVLRGFFGFFIAPGPMDVWLGLLLGVPLLAYAYKARHDRRSVSLMLAAAALALAMYSYIAARLFVVLVALIVAHHLLTQQKALSRRAWTPLLLSLLLAALGAVAYVAASPKGIKSASALGLFGLFLLAVSGVLMLVFWVKQRDLLKDWVRPLGLALGVGLVVAGPLYAYSLAHQKEVAARSYRVSIFNDEEADRRAWGVKLAENLGPTMGMMNVRGDGNPRHNLPGEIMVNPLWALFFGLGIFYALLRLRDPRAWLALTLWQISLIAGYFSIEAPQAYRCISAIPAVLLVLGLVLERGVTPLRRGLGKDAPWAVGLLLLGVLLGGGYYEINTYFNRQPKHPGVWAEFSASEYLMGKDLKELNSNGHHTRGLVRPDWADSYTFRFMTYPERNYEYFEVARHVPIREPQSAPGEDYLYVLGQSYQPLAGVLKGFYPHGVYKEVHHPYTKELLYWSYLVTAQEVASAGKINSGLKGRYFQDIAADPQKPQDGPHWVAGLKRRDQLDPFVLFDWTVSPVPGFFSAEWTGSLKAPKGGDYEFHLASNSYGLLEIDGHKVAERKFDPPGADWVVGKVKLSPGKHRLRLRYFEARNYSRLELWWTPPGGTKEVVPSEFLSPE